MAQATPRHLIDLALFAAGVGVALAVIEWGWLLAMAGLVVLTGIVEGVGAARRGRLRWVMGWLPAAAGIVGAWLAAIVLTPTPPAATHSDLGPGLGLALIGAVVFLPLFGVIATSFAVLTRAVASR